MRGWFSEEREQNKNLNTDGWMLQKMGIGDYGREKWAEYGSYLSLLKYLFVGFQCCDNEQQGYVMNEINVLGKLWQVTPFHF